MPRNSTENNINYESVQLGDAASSRDLEAAMIATKTDIIVVATGNGQNLTKEGNTIRTANAKALVEVLKKPRFNYIKVAVVGSAGGGSSKIIVGMGIGKLIGFHLRYVLHDHTGQEQVFQVIHDRVYVVRASSLTDNAPTGKLVTYGDEEKPPSVHTDRADLADWISHAICGPNSANVFGTTVNVTGVKE